ncbi:hypothetical protein ACFXP7_11560 [Microbacterium sp. P06]
MSDKEQRDSTDIDTDAATGGAPDDVDTTDEDGTPTENPSG